MKRITAITQQRLYRILVVVGLPVLILSLVIFRPAVARDNALTKPSPALAQCFTSLGATTSYSSANSLAVQAAIDAASPGSVVKIAGYCKDTVVRSGLTQTAYISKALTLIGGYTTADWNTSNPLANPTVLDANHTGRVIYATAPITVENLTLQNGTVNGVNSRGGGLYANQAVVVSNTKLLTNTATGSTGEGGGVFAFTTLSLNGSRLIDNIAGYSGGGAFSLGNAVVTGSYFQKNVSGYTGGGLTTLGDLTTTDTFFVSNTAISLGGGVYSEGATQLTGGLFLNNTNSFNGDGAFIYNWQGGHSRIVNVLFIHDSGFSGYAMLGLYGAISSTTDIVHVTIADPILNSNSAIRVFSGTVYITNTIVASHSIGIEQFDGLVRADYDLFYGNGSNLSGTVSAGTHNQFGNPLFVSAPSDNYHLKDGSAAINNGTNAGVYVDNDGTLRPQAGLFDIGAYEWVFPFSIDLPLVLKNF